LLTYASVIEIPTVPSHNSIDDDQDTEKFQPLLKRFGAHHLLWLDCLQKVEDGQIKRLLGMWPPGTSKSTYSSVVFPTHFLGRFPKKSVILASYGSDLPKKFGRRARSIVQQEVYQRIFDCKLSEESSAVDEWMLTNGSEWMAAGILTGITGNRADGIIWDDLIKGREQADSETVRSKTWDAYVDDLLTRKKPNAFEIGINTHWHEDDPAGRLLPENYNGESGWLKCRDGNDWFVVCLPAIAERNDDILGRKPGDRIWPEWFPEDYFETFKRQPRTWSALYQQRPAPDTGDFFQGDWLKPWPTGFDPVKARESMHVYGASDYAVTQDGGDYTVHLVVGVDNMDRMFLLDMWRQQASSDKWIEAFCDLVAKWRPLGWAEEAGQIKSGVGPYLTKRLRERQLYIARKVLPSKADKAIRAQSIRGRMAMNGLYCPFHAMWFSRFKEELLKFPAAKNDDIVDALSLLGQVLDKMVKGRPTANPDARPKVFSTNPHDCTVTLEDLWQANEKRYEKRSVFIH
jgi:predicted phage terminase large subunit-like protein